MHRAAAATRGSQASPLGTKLLRSSQLVFLSALWQDSWEIPSHCSAEGVASKAMVIIGLRARMQEMNRCRFVVYTLAYTQS